MSTTATRVRATTEDALLVTRRRARLDLGLLVGTGILLTATLVAVLAVPRLLHATAQEALRDAVVAAGTEAMIEMEAPAPSYVDPGTPVLAEPVFAATVLDRAADGALLPATAVATSIPYTATGDGATFRARLVTLETPGVPEDPVRWVAGREPALVPPPPDPLPADVAPVPDEVPVTASVEVGLAVPVARALGIDPTAEPVTIRLSTSRGGLAYDAHVTGLYEPVDADRGPWPAAPDLLAVPEGRATDVVGMYVPLESRPDMARVMGVPALSGSAVAAVDLDRLDVADVDQLRRSVLTFLSVHRAWTSLPQVLAAFDAHLGATMAQATLVMAGMGATAACCLVLAGSLLVERRRTHLAGERARGASLASVALRSAVESLPTALLAAVVAAVVVTVWLPEGSGSGDLALAITTVAVVAPMVLATRAAASAWTGRRVPADRRERARLAALRGTRRLVVELTCVALAVVALLTLHGRGLVPRATPRADPLLAAAPFLLALTASLVVVRVAPAVVRLAARWAARSRGLAAPLATTRALRGATALLPLVTVTVAVALVVVSGVLVQTVRDGQRIAADQLVAADVRIDGPLGTDEAVAALAQLAEADGVTALATGIQTTDRAFGRGTEPTATVLIVDTAALAEVRRARGLHVDEGLTRLAELGADGRVPVLASAELLERVEHADGTLVQMVSKRFEAEVVGTTTLTGDIGAPPTDVRAAQATVTGDDGVVVVDIGVAGRLADRLPAATRAWVAGPGAAEAVAGSGLEKLPGITVTTADGWWLDWSSEPLPQALTTLLVVVVGLLALLAVIALVLVVVATAGERGRTLSTLRTLGLDARTARWATLGELAPLVLGGLVGGTVIGMMLPRLMVEPLGLAWVTGAPGDVPVSMTWWPALVAAGALAVALTVAVLVEQAVRRRERLGEVLRVGAR